MSRMLHIPLSLRIGLDRYPGGGLCRLFACLNFIPPEKSGIIGNLKLRLLGPAVSVSDYEAIGQSFPLITVSRCRNLESAWGAIEKALPEGLAFIICEDGTELPREFSAPGFSRYGEALFIHAANRLADGLPLNRRTAGLCDLNARYLSLTEYLLSNYRSIQIMTREINRYELLAERLLEEKGAPVTVSENTAFDDCGIIFCPDSDLPGNINPRIPILSVKPIPGRLVFSEPHAAVIGGAPPKISPHKLAGAIYEQDPAAKPPAAASLLLNGKRIPIERAKAIIAGSFYN